MQKTRTDRVLAATLALLVVLALPAFAEGKKGKANITPQTTMKELRENPSIADSGFFIPIRRIRTARRASACGNEPRWNSIPTAMWPKAAPTA